MPDEETKDAGVDAEGGPQLDKNNALSYKKVEKRVHTKVPSFLGGSKAAAKPANDEASAREKFEALAGGAGKEITLKQYKQLMTKVRHCTHMRMLDMLEGLRILWHAMFLASSAPQTMRRITVPSIQSTILFNYLLLFLRPRRDCFVVVQGFAGCGAERTRPGAGVYAR